MINPISEYFPNGVGSTVYHDSISDYSYQAMIWDNPARAYSLRVCDLYCPAYEHETFFYTAPGQCWPGAYTGAWASDLPNAYLDTDFLDPPEYGNRAGGSAFSLPLATGRWYYHFLRLDGICQDGYPYKIKSQDSYYDPNAFNCTGEPSNYQWCVYEREGSPRDYVPISSVGVVTGPNTKWMGYNQLTNRSFESGFTGWGTWGNPSYTIYSGGAKEDSQFVEFNCRGVQQWCSVYQDKGFPVEPNYVFTAEVALRCNSSVPCPVSLTLWGRGINADEYAGRNITVPTGSWIVYGLIGKNFLRHSQLRLEVYTGPSPRISM